MIVVPVKCFLKSISILSFNIFTLVVRGSGRSTGFYVCQGPISQRHSDLAKFSAKSGS